LFDLAADVERYPTYLRWWISAQVRQREANAYCTDQILGLGPIRIKFASKTNLHRPRRIDVTSDQSPFRQFRLSWVFAPESAAGCRVSLAVELEFNSGLLEKVVEQALPAAIADILTAFEARAHRLYGSAEQPIETAPSI
jgi:coenzyme Q-binding protein COQ10